jgi:hypothetical protein
LSGLSRDRVAVSAATCHSSDLSQESKGAGGRVGLILPRTQCVVELEGGADGLGCDRSRRLRSDMGAVP